jgi:uncharacterized membrane protein YccC
MDEPAAKPSLLKRFIALIVLLVAGFFLLKWLVSLIAGLVTVGLIVVAFVALIWAWRTL